MTPQECKNAPATSAQSRVQPQVRLQGDGASGAATRSTLPFGRLLFPVVGAIAIAFGACSAEPDPFTEPDVADDVVDDAGVDAVDASEDVIVDTGPAPDQSDVVPVEPAIPRLTDVQYRNSVATLFGSEVIVPPRLEVDIESAGLFSIGAGQASISTRGAEMYEAAAYSVASQVLAPESRDAFVSCAPSGVDDPTCAETFIAEQGLRLWRRPLTDTEIEAISTVSSLAATTLDDFYIGLEYGLAALLQSPHFLFRIDLGEDDATVPGTRRYNDYEMASRLSFFLWNTTPNDAMLVAAEAGEFTDEESLRRWAEDMIADPQIRDGVRHMFTELFRLHELDAISKDPFIFEGYTQDFAESAREETLLLVDWLVFERGGDFRDIMTTQTTFLNRKMASLYSVPAPSRDGFAQVELSEDDGRRGLLGHASILAMNSHPTSTSASLRGRFVRQTLLCGIILPPPADVDASIPPPSGTTLTLRDRVVEHVVDDSCAGCHLLMDPIGLGLEQFDGIGRWRETDNGAQIDPAGDLDGIEFDDAWSLGQAVHDHPLFAACMVRNVVRYATSQEGDRDQRSGLDFLSWSFATSGYDFQDLLVETVMSPTFRYTRPPSEEENP